MSMALQVYDKLKHAIRFWLLGRLPTCKQTVEVISQSLERPLSLRERMLLKLHLWVCLWYLEHLQIMKDTMRANAAETAEIDPAVTLPAEARERIKRRLSSQQ